MIDLNTSAPLDLAAPLERHEAASTAATPELSRLLTGLGLASLYGLALGAREGGLGLLGHALGVPVGLALVTAIGTPSLFVLLALLDSPVSHTELWRATARGICAAGLLLAGLAPASAMLLVTIQSSEAIEWVVRGGLVLGGGVGLSTLAGAVRERLGAATHLTRFKAQCLLGGFALFSGALAARVWGSVLPILEGLA